MMEAVEEGARSILVDCAGIAPGDRVLIVGEEGPDAFFDFAVCERVASAARSLKAVVSVVRAPAIAGPEDLPSDFADLIAAADHVLFFARIGDQLRFTPLPGAGRKIMCYTRDEHYLADRFARLPYGLFTEILSLLQQEMVRAKAWHIECPEGTNLDGGFDGAEVREAVAAEKGFSVSLFPVMIYPPLSCRHMTGDLVLSRFLISTSTTMMADSLLPLRAPVTARIEGGAITKLHGPGDVVETIEAHLDRCAGREPALARRFHSWHAGIYPPTFFSGKAEDDIESWGDVAFGSPRYTHFHFCGPEPGMVAASLFDTTISIDGRAFWSKGEFVFLDRPECRAMLDKYGCDGSAFQNNPNLGLSFL